VTVVDGQHLISNAFAAKRTTPLLMSGAVLHILPAGSEFDLASRSLVAHQTAIPDPEVLEARAAEADLREVMREVAAEDASPAYRGRVRRNGRR
jgi:cyanophycinase